mmetsp:Transcript_9981/g.16337  ORF Transcript_9981/g.16337 Transcript_9981/m.16337 type:complete len:84 (-) Transcript_9981:112-363(-)
MVNLSSHRSTKVGLGYTQNMSVGFSQRLEINGEQFWTRRNNRHENPIAVGRPMIVVFHIAPLVKSWQVETLHLMRLTPGAMLC